MKRTHLLIGIVLSCMLSNCISLSEKKSLYPFENQENALWGYKNENGKIVVEPKYTYAQEFNHGYARVSIRGKAGLLDSTGKEIIQPLKYTHIGNFISEKFVTVEAGKKSGMLDFTTGEEILPPVNGSIIPLNNGMIAIASDRKTGLLSKAGEEIIPLSFKYAYIKTLCSEGLIGVFANNKWGYIDTTGKEVIPFEYEIINDFSEGVASVRLNEKWGFIDKTQKTIIPFNYQSANNFSENLAAVMLNGQWGYIDKTGQVVIPFKFDKAESFENGGATVYIKGEKLRINKRGHTI